MSKKEPRQRGSALARALRATAPDAEIAGGVREYSDAWLAKLGGLRHAGAPVLAVITSQKLTLQLLLLLNERMAKPSPDDDWQEIGKTLVPLSNNFRLGEKLLETYIAGKKGGHGGDALAEVMRRYSKKSEEVR